MEKKFITREELYEQLWLKPANKIAEELGVSPYALTKLCKDLNIPKPPMGHWQQVEVGRGMKRPPLPEVPADASSEVVIQQTILETPTWMQNPEVIERIKAERQPKNRIQVAETLYNMHPLIRETKLTLEKMTPDKYGMVSLWRNSPCLHMRVSKGSLNRALRIMDALVKALEARGYKIEVAEQDYVYTKVVIGGEKIKILFQEKSDRSDRPLTKEEKKKPLYEIYDRWEFTPSGKFTFLIDEYVPEDGRKRWSDKIGEPLEEQLNEVIIGLNTCAEGLRLRTLRRKEEARRRVEEEIRRQEEARLWQ